MDQGWLSGDTFQQSGTANLGLLDQRFAFEWVQEYIHLFGGDPDRVTILAESAGTGSILYHITANSNPRYRSPFRIRSYTKSVYISTSWRGGTGKPLSSGLDHFECYEFRRTPVHALQSITSFQQLAH